MIFVHWKKGSEWWLERSPLIFKSFVAINYIFIPVVNCLISLSLIFDPRVNLKIEVLESYVIVFFIVCVMRIVEFFTIVRRTILLDAKNYLENR